MPFVSDCVLCGALVGEARASEHWRVVVNRNQNLLGKTMLVLRRHRVRVADLSEEEWDDLRAQIVDVTDRLDRAFSPDHYNYAFLQNADRHVHLHVIPRYASEREFAGARFEDPDWPEHYLPGREWLAPPETIAAISSELV
jgi:diadenosine tetraphosphate (Ap4A) HIT family hydrolase